MAVSLFNLKWQTKHYLFSFFGCGQVSQGGLAHLEAFPVEPVAAVDVDGPLDVTDVVSDERSAVDQEISRTISRSTLWERGLGRQL